MKIGILIICTGKYSVFFKSLYESCEKHFLKNHEKTYYVFTDDEEITSNSNVVKINQNKLGWPFDTLKRFSIFNNSKELLINEDYLYFLNANMLCVQDVNEEIIPDEKNDYLTAVQHPGFYSQENYVFTYERNPKSNFYIPYGEGKYYFQGCFIGGRTNEFLNMSEYLDKLIDEDLSNEIIPVWWDESAMNWYFKEKNPLIIDRHYAYPENHVYSNVFIEKTKILNRDKSKFGGHGFLREK